MKIRLKSLNLSNLSNIFYKQKLKFFRMKNILKYFISMPFMGFLLVVYAVAMAVATFIENDYGADISKYMVYNAWWFELIQFGLVINMIGNVFVYKLYKKEKISILLFHLAFIVILLGAGITRYMGFEGMMHIREGNTTNEFFSEKTYIQIRKSGKENVTIFDEEKFISPYLRNEFESDFSYNEKNYTVKLNNLIVNAQKTIYETEGGKPMVQLIFSENKQFRSYYINDKENKKLAGINFSLNKPDRQEVQFTIENKELFVKTTDSLKVFTMQGELDTIAAPNQKLKLTSGKICTVKERTFVMKNFYESAKIKYSQGNISNGISSSTLEFEISDGENTETVYSEYLKNRKNTPVAFRLGGKEFEFEFGVKLMNLPFKLKLRDFQLDRYPGSMSPSSYASEVTLIDKENNISEKARIFMNNILEHRGYRFYQSSYDNDEKGTVLQVNHDKPGTVVTYIGYFLLLVGIIWSMINKSSFFAELSRRTSQIRNKRSKVATLMLLLLFMGSHSLYAQNLPGHTHSAQAPVKKSYDKQHAELFGRLLVQDPGGRIKPMLTMSNEVLRKLCRKESWDGFNSNQVFMGMLFNSNYWKTVKMIKVGNPEISKKYGLSEKFVAFNDLVSERNGYILKDDVEKAFSKPAGEQSKYDKEIINVDERLNIAYQIYSWKYMRIFPVPDDSHKSWLTPFDVSSLHDSLDYEFAKTAFSKYFTEISKAWTDGNWTSADKALKEIQDYQKSHAAEILPSENRLDMEVLYLKLNIFKRVFMFYGAVGLIFLIVLFAGILKPGLNLKLISRIFAGILAVLFLFHTFGLGLRWYISGRAPFSNGYESLINIAWFIMLAGFIFRKKSPITLAATGILASITLMVANLSWMNPEITNLVPVLKSYWLTIHVSVIIAGYAFLAIGALIGLLSLLLMVFSNRSNQKRIKNTLSELTNVNHMTLIIGLYLLTLGTFLGAVWANESWGRYWGWDPKETWALISIIVYTFVTHSRFIPFFNNKFYFNFLSLIGFSSILMTYFGVNYYLSGLHSYAQGDPVPIPNWVYYSVAAVFIISAIAYFKAAKLKLTLPDERK